MTIPRFKHVELEITSTCDMGCPHCDRFIDWAPTSSMTLEQVQHFVAESLALEWQWDRIHVLGGEPTLHKQFREVVTALLSYRERYPQCLLRVISNGSGKLGEHRAWLKQEQVAVNVESKTGGLPPWFTNILRAPKDVTGDPAPLGPCGIFGISGCGLGLTKHGFFLCGAGASVARVCGLDIGIQRLADVTYEGMLEQARALCNICGHHHTTHLPVTKDASVSAFWTTTMECYRAKAPALSLYGSAL